MVGRRRLRRCNTCHCGYVSIWQQVCSCSWWTCSSQAACRLPASLPTSLQYYTAYPSVAGCQNDAQDTLCWITWEWHLSQLFEQREAGSWVGGKLDRGAMWEQNAMPSKAAPPRWSWRLVLGISRKWNVGNFLPCWKDNKLKRIYCFSLIHSGITVTGKIQ